MSIMHFSNSAANLAEVERLNDPDRLKRIGWAVRGALVEWAANTGQDSANEHFQQYILDSITLIQAYLTCGVDTDARFSDIQVIIAHELRKDYL